MSEELSHLQFERDSASVIGPKIRSCIEAGETVTLQVSGDSMRPTLHPRRDAAVLTALQSWPPKVGDILFFEREAGGYVLHRVIRVRDGVCTMNGDAQTWTEEAREDMAIAVACALIRKGKIINCDNRLYRAALKLWGITRPFRFKMFAVWRKVKGVE